MKERALLHNVMVASTFRMVNQRVIITLYNTRVEATHVQNWWFRNGVWLAKVKRDLALTRA